MKTDNENLKKLKYEKPCLLALDTVYSFIFATNDSADPDKDPGDDGGGEEG